jgi:clan AA aspartic protease (TIGR02281 family)
MGVRGIVLLLFAALLFSHPSSGWGGDIYRYVDKDGIVHFTDIPPRSGKALEKIYIGEKEPEEEAVSKDEDSQDTDEFVIPFAGRSGRMNSRREVVVDVTLSRGGKYIRRKFVVDTGATNTVITQADAKALGIKEKDVTDSSVGVLAGGAKVVVHRVKLSRLQLGDMVLQSPKVAVLYKGDRLLGMDILGRYNIQVDNDKSLLILQKR